MFDKLKAMASGFGMAFGGGNISIDKHTIIKMLGPLITDEFVNGLRSDIYAWILAEELKAGGPLIVRAEMAVDHSTAVIEVYRRDPMDPGRVEHFKTIDLNTYNAKKIKDLLNGLPEQPEQRFELPAAAIATEPEHSGDE